MLRSRIVLALSLLATPVAAQDPIDFSRLRPATDSFVVLVQGQPIGYELIKLEKAENGFLITDDTNLMPRLQQRTDVAIGATGAMTSVKQRGTIMGKEMSIDVAYADGKAKGSATVPGPDGAMTTKDVAADVPANAVDDNVLLPLLPGVAWRPGLVVTVPVFASGKNALHQVTLTVVGTERLQVPAGMFDAYKVTVDGLTQGMTLYVNAGLPHRVLKAAPVGVPMEFVAAR
jgi:hypothetical protein